MEKTKTRGKPGQKSRKNIARQGSRKKIQNIDDSGHCKAFREGSTTCRQKRSLAPRNDASSIPCHVCDRKPSVNIERICHTTNVAVAPIQPIVGGNNMRPSCLLPQNHFGQFTSAGSLAVTVIAPCRLTMPSHPGLFCRYYELVYSLLFTAPSP